jgi:hypothetical protein
MKHLTPERYLRLGDLGSEQAFLAAQQDWEDALTAYRADLERVPPAFAASSSRCTSTTPAS